MFALQYHVFSQEKVKVANGKGVLCCDKNFKARQSLQLGKVDAD